MSWWTLTACFLLFDGDDEGQEPGDCTDAADNDGDGDFDCNDEGCFGSPDCEGAPTGPMPTEGPPLPPTPTEPPDTGTAPPPPSELRIAWSFENGQDCAKNGVDTVLITLTRAEDPLLASVAEPCDLGETAFTGLEPGDLGVLLEGLDDGDVPRFFSQDVVDLFPDEETSIQLLLQPIVL